MYCVSQQEALSSREPMSDMVFGRYWAHKAAKEKAARLPRPVLRSFETDGLDETEELFWRTCELSGSILDIGAGDNRVKRKFLERGYSGSYLTYDLSREFDHDFYALRDINGSFDAILLLEVIEHMTLEEFYALMERLDGLLAKRGIFIVSTPNPACISSMWAGDMTHVQQYPLNDLLAFFMVRGFSCEAYRVLYSRKRVTLADQFRQFLRKVLVTQVLGADYADGIIVIARRAVLK